MVQGSWGCVKGTGSVQSEGCSDDEEGGDAEAEQERIQLQLQHGMGRKWPLRALRRDESAVAAPLARRPPAAWNTF